MAPTAPNDLEEAFFAGENARALEHLRKQADREEQREILRRIVTVQDDAFLDRLIAMDLTPQRAMALRLIPLVFVAWADGNIDEREREAVMKAAVQQNIVAEDLARQVLQDWLSHRPDPGILELWKDYVRRIWPRFTPDEQLQMRNNLLTAAREVAESAGGFLGLATISAAERELLDELDEVVA